MKKCIFAFLALCILVFLVSWANPKISSQISKDTSPFDVNVKINIKVIVDNKLKNVDPNIIKAARQALFVMYSDRAKFSYYNNYEVNQTMKINEVISKGDSEWEVRYNEDNIGYSYVTVEKQKDGNYKGYTVYGNPNEKVGETY